MNPQCTSSLFNRTSTLSYLFRFFFFFFQLLDISRISVYIYLSNLDFIVHPSIHCCYFFFIVHFLILPAISIFSFKRQFEP